MKQLTFLILLACLGACKQFTDPSLSIEYVEDSRTLNIENFNWSYGLVGINQFGGDFDKLDEKVYNLLKGKTGICQVYLNNGSKDKYGNVSEEMENVGSIDIDELNKFQDWTYWQKEHGIRTMLYKKHIEKDSDAASSDSSPISNHSVDTTEAVQNSPIDDFQPNTSNSELFSIEQLYPTDEKPPMSETERFVITGTIDKIKFDEGVFSVISIDGDKVVMMFDPTHMEQTEVQRLSSVLVYGNKIKCVGTNSGEHIYELLAARITSQ